MCSPPLLSPLRDVLVSPSTSVSRSGVLVALLSSQQASLEESLVALPLPLVAQSLEASLVALPWAASLVRLPWASLVRLSWAS